MKCCCFGHFHGINALINRSSACSVSDHVLGPGVLDEEVALVLTLARTSVWARLAWHGAPGEAGTGVVVGSPGAVLAQPEGPVGETGEEERGHSRPRTAQQDPQQRAWGLGKQVSQKLVRGPCHDSCVSRMHDTW